MSLERLRSICEDLKAGGGGEEEEEEEKRRRNAHCLTRW
jgi:hypothetical protein